MISRIEDYLSRVYATEIVPDEYTDGGVTYVASHPDLPGCMAHGDSPEEARVNLDEARDLYIRTLLARGIDPPMPCASRLDIVWVTLHQTHPGLLRSVTSSYQVTASGNATRLDQGQAGNNTATGDIWAGVH